MALEVSEVIEIAKLVQELIKPLEERALDALLNGRDPVAEMALGTVEDYLPATLRLEAAMLAEKRRRALASAPKPPPPDPV